MKYIITCFVLFLSVGNLFSQEVKFEEHFIDKSLRMDYLIAGSSEASTVFFKQYKEEPFWGGSQVNLIDKFDLGDYRVLMSDSSSSKLIYSRGFSSLFYEWQDTDQAKLRERSFYESVVMPFPKQTTKIKIQTRNANNEFIDLYTTYCNPNNYFIVKEKNNKYKTRKVHYSGDHHKKLDVVILPEGYTEEEMEKFHKDFIYHEEPGQGHWWDISDEPGADCVDWPPLFDFFARRARPEKERIREIEFITASPGISPKNNWLTIEAQKKQLDLSKVNIRFDPGKRRFVGTTENVIRMSFDLTILDGDDPILFEIDDQKIENVVIPSAEKKIWLKKNESQWELAEKPSPSVKGPHRYGTFKDAFQNRFMFVYGTHGNKKENDWAYAKSRYDAEHFWYQGNGSIDIIPDDEFNAKSEPDRNVILYGNSQTNSAWEMLLGDSPVEVLQDKIKIGDKSLEGKNLACLLIRPRPGSDFASIGAVSGTGLTGMRLTNRRPYLNPGYGYPDFIIFTLEMLTNQEQGVKVAGFFGLDWGLESAEMVWNSDTQLIQK